MMSGYVQPPSESFQGGSCKVLWKAVAWIRDERQSLEKSGMDMMSAQILKSYCYAENWNKEIKIEIL